MRAGFAKLDITPDLAQIPVCNLGYWDQRAIPFTGVRDPLFVRCAAFGTGSKRQFLIAVDSIFDSYGFSPRAAARIAQAHNVRPEQVWITCSHSHSAPLIGLNQTTQGVHYGAQVEDAIVAAAQLAAQRQSDASASLHTVHVPEVLYNRRPLLTTGRVAELHAPLDPTCVVDPGPLNDTLTMIQFRTPGGALIGAWCHFAIHGVCIQCSPLISSDCMGQAIQRMEADSHDEAVFLFTNGACGDVDPAAMGGARALETTANALHVALTAATQRPGAPLPFSPTCCRAGVFTARRRATRSLAALEVARASLVSKTSTERAARHHVGPGYEHFLLDEEARVASLPPEIPIHFQIWRTGNLIWLGVAGEIFTQSAQDLAHALAPRQALVVGYTGGWLGYFCPRPAYDQGGYEVACASWSPFAPGETERLLTHLLAQANTLG